MSTLIRFGISAEEELTRSFDELSAERGYGNRSEALRDLMRDALVQSRVKAQPDKTEIIASLTLRRNFQLTNHSSLNTLQLPS